MHLKEACCAHINTTAHSHAYLIFFFLTLERTNRDMMNERENEIQEKLLYSKKVVGIKNKKQYTLCGIRYVTILGL